VVTNKQREGLDLIPPRRGARGGKRVQRFSPHAGHHRPAHGGRLLYDFFAERSRGGSGEDREGGNERSQGPPFVRKGGLAGREALQLFEKLGEKLSSNRRGHLQQGAKTLDALPHGDWVDFCLGPHAP